MGLESVVVRVDFGFGGIEGESNKTRNNDPIVLDRGLGVLWFVGVLVGDFGEVDFGDVEAVGNVLESSVVSDSAVYHVVALAGDRVVLLKEHRLSYLIIIISINSHYLHPLTCFKHNYPKLYFLEK